MARRRPVAEQVVAALAEYLRREPRSISLSHHLRDDLGLDSMAIIELLYKIEEVFDLQIPDSDLPALTTVGHVVAYAENTRSPGPATGRKSSPPTPKRKKT
jgi:acyl carrier protein